MSRQRRTVGVLDRAYAGTTSTLRAARSDVVGWLKEHKIDEDLRDRAALVLSELASNAVQASPGSAYGLRVSLVDDGSVLMAVTSRTARDRPPPRDDWGPATVLASRGRGLLIVGKLSDQVDVDQSAAGTVVVTATLRSAAHD
jgi:anti-sigma regulatory factor (Ser/Thr protein kinase)